MPDIDLKGNLPKKMSNEVRWRSRSRTPRPVLQFTPGSTRSGRTYSARSSSAGSSNGRGRQRARTTSRTRSLPPSRSASRSVSSIRSRRSATPSRNGWIAQGIKGTVRAIKGYKKGSTRALIKKKKGPYVSPKFRKLVKKVMEPSDRKGHTKWTVESIWKTDPALFNQQHYLSNFGTVSGGVGIVPGYANRGNIFTPQKIWNQFQYLWHNKGITDVRWTQGDSPTPTDTIPLFGSGNKLFLKNTWFSMDIKNNSQRSYKLKLFECAPTKVFADTNAGGASPQPLAFNDYVAAVEQATTNGTWGSYYNGTSNSVNPINNFGITPEQFKEFNSKWKCNCITIKLQPGQIYKWFIQGPAGVTLDYQKFYQGETFQDFQKFSRSIFISATPDYVSSSTPVTNSIPTQYYAGHYPDRGVGTEFLITSTFGYNLRMPDDTGFQARNVPPQAQDVPLDARKDKNLNIYYPYIADSEPAANTVIRIDEVVPTQPITNT